LIFSDVWLCYFSQILFFVLCLKYKADAIGLFGMSKTAIQSIAGSLINKNKYDS